MDANPIPLAELLEAPVDVELAVAAREALRALAGLRWRRRRALVLHAAGCSYKEIVQRLGGHGCHSLEHLDADDPDLGTHGSAARHPARRRLHHVYFENANGAGEENRNVARMAALLADLPTSVPGATVNRLCGSGTEATVAANACSCAVVKGDVQVLVLPLVKHRGLTAGLADDRQVVAGLDRSMNSAVFVDERQRPAVRVSSASKCRLA